MWSVDLVAAFEVGGLVVGDVPVPHVRNQAVVLPLFAGGTDVVVILLPRPSLRSGGEGKVDEVEPGEGRVLSVAFGHGIDEVEGV